MPRVDWPLRNGRPSIEVILPSAEGGQPLVRSLLADTGAGSVLSGFELILAEADCLACVGIPAQPITLGGAYVGTFPVYQLPVQIPALGFAQDLWAVGVPSVRPGFDGIACFRLINQFHYGNFGDPGIFGLES
jgi:hypothetical protein